MAKKQQIPPRKPGGSTGPSISDAFRDEVVAHTVDLLRVAESSREKIVVNLELLAEEIQAKLESTALTVAAQARLQALLDQIARTIFSAYRTNADILKSDLRDVATYAGEFVPKMMNKVLQAPIVTTSWTKRDLLALSDETMIQGAPQAEWWSHQAQLTKMRFTTEIRNGVLAGETNQQLVARIRGTKTGRTRTMTDSEGDTMSVPEYRGGVMEVSKREATALVRTSVQTVNNDVLNATYEDNQDVLKGRQWLSTLDARTSEICRARDKAAWDFEGNPLPDSVKQIPFPGPPPAHFNCRSVLIPITKTWDELAGTKGIAEPPESTRASMDGQVAGEMTYEDWLQQQPESVQRDVLGESRYQLWKDGKIDSFTQLVDQSGRSLTIDELQSKLG